MKYYCNIIIWREIEKSEVLIKFLLYFRQSGDVLFFLNARRLRGYTATSSYYSTSSSELSPSPTAQTAQANWNNVHMYNVHLQIWWNWKGRKAQMGLFCQIIIFTLTYVSKVYFRQLMKGSFHQDVVVLFWRLDMRLQLKCFHKNCLCKWYLFFVKLLLFWVSDFQKNWILWKNIWHEKHLDDQLQNM